MWSEYCATILFNLLIFYCGCIVYFFFFFFFKFKEKVYEVNNMQTSCLLPGDNTSHCFFKGYAINLREKYIRLALFLSCFTVGA